VAEARSTAVPVEEPRRRNALAPFLRVPYQWMSPAGGRGRLSVLIFHRVRERQDPLFARTAHAESFRKRMEWVCELCNVLPLDEAIAGLSRGTLPDRAVSITFDDGYADNATVALPILRSLGITATFFVSTGFIDGGRMWNDTIVEVVRRTTGPTLDVSARGLGVHSIVDPAARRKAAGVLLRALKFLPPAERQTQLDQVVASAGVALPDDLMMTRAQVRMLADAGMGIGAHTVSHPILATIDADEARREIGEGRETLEGIVGRKVSMFAYPNGRPDRDYRREHVEIVKALGFDAAFTTSAGAAAVGDSLFELPRFTPWDRTAARSAVRMMRNLTTSTQRVAT